MSKDTIDIYEIPKEIENENKTTNKYGKLYCEINSKVIIQDFILNPNYLDILVVVNTKKILFFTIPETFDKKLIMKPKFTFNSNNVTFDSVLFNPINSHILACSCEEKINSNFVKIDENISIILENGVIVAIVFHEYGHAMHTIFSLLEKEYISNGTPRKKYLKLREGGYYLEIALFGRIIKNLSYGEALYILNEDNYKKSLEEFRKGFMELSSKDLYLKGQFDYLNLKNESELKDLMHSISIKAKNSNNEKSNIIKDLKISIPWKNDVIGRHIKQEDLEPYF